MKTPEPSTLSVCVPPNPKSHFIKFIRVPHGVNTTLQPSLHTPENCLYSVAVDRFFQATLKFIALGVEVTARQGTFLTTGLGLIHSLDPDQTD